MNNTALSQPLAPSLNPLTSLMFSTMSAQVADLANEETYDKPLAHLTFYGTHVIKTQYEGEGKQQKQISKLVNPQDVAIAMSNLVNLNTGLLPRDTVAAGFAQGELFITVYLPPTIREIEAKINGKVRKYTLPTPGLIFSAYKQSMKLFAYQNDYFEPKAPLFVAPYPNIHSDGVICKGNVEFPMASAKTIYDMSNLFFKSRFNNDLSGGKTQISKSLFELWERLNGEKSYPLDELVPTNRRLEEVLKW